MAGLYTRRSSLRHCTYKDKSYYFHTWIQESEPDTGGTLMYVGAILEDEDGNISKVFDITEIKFNLEVER